jgi:hypothetical protein
MIYSHICGTVLVEFSDIILTANKYKLLLVPIHKLLQGHIFLYLENIN